MVNVKPYADFLADRMVVVRRHQRQDFRTGPQAQGVEELGTPKGLGDDLGLDFAGIVVDDIVRTQQDVQPAPTLAFATA